MPRLLLRRFVLVALALSAASALGVGLTPRPAWAHNTLLSSDPADGAALSAMPEQITWTFDKAVPLETMTVTLIDATGARSELNGSMHGTGGDTEVVTPLPILPAGLISLRWRLVGPDGHPITGRVDFTAAGPAPSPATTAPTAAVAGRAPTPNASPPAVVTFPDEGDGSYSTPSSLRWVLRYGSYIAIMAIVGILLTGAFVWSGADRHPLLRRILDRSLLATSVLGFVQLLVIASDVSGRGPWASVGAMSAATATDAGMALAIRVLLASTMWLLLFRYPFTYRDVYWTALSFAGIALLATWAFAGHSRSMRWPEVGVVTDVAHHGAAAAWIAGLAIIGWIVIPNLPAEVLVPAVRRFSKTAVISVAVLIGTGLLQSVRLVGNPLDLLDADHGRYLLAKTAVLAGMLGIANGNRRRVDSRLDDVATLHLRTVTLRRAVVAEFVTGLVVVAITAAMVVSPPSSARSAQSGLAVPRSALYYIV